MRRLRRNLLLASIFAAAPLSMIAPSPLSAQVSVTVGIESFHNELGPYGDWYYSDRWGEVWRPGSQDRDPDWRPYWAGHWADTDEYGWTWISDEGPWGDIAYHYGRWVFDPDDGWLWLPGYVWSPAWVVWRSAGDDVGWMPMPPDDDFLRPSGISIGVRFGDWNDIGGYYGYSRWYGPGFDQTRFGRLWVFVPGGRLADPGYRRYALARPQTIDMVRRSRNITNYTVVNNVIINRSVNVNMVRGGGGRPPQPVRANTVLHSTRWVAPVNQGAQIQQRARQERPHGNGMANSAPPPSQAQIQSLSTRAIPVRTQNNAPGNRNNGPSNNAGNRASHLFNRNNVAQFSGRAGGQREQPNPQAQPNQQAQPNPQAQPNRQSQPAPQVQQTNPPGNDNNRERRPQNNALQNNRPDNNRPENARPGNRGPEPAPPAPNAAAPAPNPAERNLGRPQQLQPQAVSPAPQPEERNNRPDRNLERNQERERERPQPQAIPERASPPPPPREATPAPPSAPNPPERNQERNFQRGAPAMEQRAQPERPATPERAAPPSPPREQRPAMEQRPSPPPAPPPQARQQRQPEAARPNPAPGADRGPPPDRSQGRGPDRGSDRGGRPDNRGNDNR